MTKTAKIPQPFRFVGIIPARYASTRFPGKPLVDIGGKTMIQRVYEQVSKVLNDVYVATDDQRIFDAVVAFGGKAIMTSDQHKSGTDRCYEAALAENVAYVPGRLFSPSGMYSNCLRINCGNPHTPAIEDAVLRLGRVFGGDLG